MDRLFNQVFTYLSEYNVLICKTHCYAIKTTALRGHLDRLHQDISSEPRNQLAIYTLALYTDLAIYCEGVGVRASVKRT